MGNSIYTADVHACRKPQDTCTATLVQWNLRTQKRCVGLRSYDVWLQFWILCQEVFLELSYCDIFMRVTTTTLARANLEISHGRWSAWTLVNYLSGTHKAGCDVINDTYHDVKSIMTSLHARTSCLPWNYYWRHTCYYATSMMSHWDTNVTLGY